MMILNILLHRAMLMAGAQPAALTNATVATGDNLTFETGDNVTFEG